MLLKSGAILEKILFEGLLRMKNSKRKENLLLEKSEKINGGTVDGVLKHVFVGFYLCFPFVCSTHTLTNTHTRPRYQRNLSFILYFPSMGLRQRFFVRWRLEVDRYLKFFSLSPLSLLRFSVAVYLTLLPRDFFCGSEFEDVESTAEVWGEGKVLMGFDG
jgi:hypothetical protein